MTREHVELTEDLGYLARMADELEVPHAIPTDAAGFLGQQQELRIAAETWRELAVTVERSSSAATGELGGIDAAWEGDGADAFLAHIREVGLAGNDLTDSMRAVAEALEHTAEALRVQIRDLRELVADVADEVREAMPEAPERARPKLVELTGPVAEILDAVADTYRAFARCCDDLGAAPENRRRFDGPTAAPPSATGAAAAASGAPTTPEDPSEPASSAETGAPVGTPCSGQPSPMAPGGTTSSAESPDDEPAASAAGGVAGAAVGAAGAGVAGGMMPMGMMGGMSAMLGRQAGRPQERTNDSRIKNDPVDLFGTPPDAAPAVFGGPDEQPDQADPGAEKRLEVPSTLQPGEPKPSIEETLGPKG